MKIRLISSFLVLLSAEPTFSQQICAVICPKIDICAASQTNGSCNCECKLAEKSEVFKKLAPKEKTDLGIPKLDLGAAAGSTKAEFRDPVSGKPVKDLVAEAEKQRAFDERMNQIIEATLEKLLINGGMNK